MRSLIYKSCQNNKLLVLCIICIIASVDNREIRLFIEVIYRNNEVNSIKFIFINLALY